MTEYTITALADMAGIETRILPNPDARVSELAFDARQIKDPARCLFFALKGERRDGHDFVWQAYERGVRQFVLSRQPDKPLPPEANILLTDDTLRALQRAAAAHRRRFDIPVIGITGSNGKTCVKEWLWHLLRPERRIVRSPLSYNSQIGVPLSVWGMGPEHELALFEAGISQPGEMAALAHIILPSIGIFTHIGEAHSESFPDRRAKAREKMRLFDACHTLIYAADPLLHELAAAWKSERSGRQTLTFRIVAEEDKGGGQEPGAGAGSEDAYVLQAEVSALSGGGARVTGRWPDGSLTEFDIPFSDMASVRNALSCRLALRVLGVEESVTRARFPLLEPLELRLKVKAGLNDCTLVDDTWSNDLDALRNALHFASRQPGPLTLILSDIPQSGRSPEALYGEVADLARAFGVRRLIGIGPEIQATSAVFAPLPERRFYPDVDGFISDIGRISFHRETILLKGARAFAFERIAYRLARKNHHCTLRISLDALLHNFAVYKRLLGPQVRTMAMVKAAAYGSGSAQVARMLEHGGADYLGVAYADEGVALRLEGISLPILTLSPSPDDFDLMQRYRLEPEIYSFDLLHAAARFASADNPLRIHLKVDTGMRRLGFMPDELPEALRRIAAGEGLRVASIFSHLAASGAPEHDAFTHLQAERFEAACQTAEVLLGYRPLRHIANTDGAARFPQYRYDMARLGIGLYGIASDPDTRAQLRVVNTLTGRISQIRALRAGESVGYNRRGILRRDSRIATINVGYADGLLRLAGDGRYAFNIRGREAPTVGSICMDMCMADVTDIPEACEGDEVIVFGQNPRVETLAEALQTIPYEVFTNISERVIRVYEYS